MASDGAVAGGGEVASTSGQQQPVRVGVLALQGSFREHTALLRRVPGVEAIEVRTKEELESVAGLIIPGGESTTMALVAERWGLIPELQAFAKAGRPIWGTCAGMIFLAEAAEGGWATGGGVGGWYSIDHLGAMPVAVGTTSTREPARCLPLRPRCQPRML